MKRTLTSYLRAVLTIVFAMGLIASSNSRMVTHDVVELSQVVADHHTKTAEHGHSHEDRVDVMHAYHGHAHVVADHDHNIAFLPPRAATAVIPPTPTGWVLSNYAMPDRRSFELERPPRV
jgi:hypothetical protein